MKYYFTKSDNPNFGWAVLKSENRDVARSKAKEMGGRYFAARNGDDLVIINSRHNAPNCGWRPCHNPLVDKAREIDLASWNGCPAGEGPWSEGIVPKTDKEVALWHNGRFGVPSVIAD